MSPAVRSAEPSRRQAHRADQRSRRPARWRTGIRGHGSVEKAVAHVNNKMSRLLLGRDALRKAEIDDELIA